MFAWWSYVKPGAEHTRFSTVLSKPCACCNQKELDILQSAQASSDEQHWIYELAVNNKCARCDVSMSWQDWLEALGFTFGIHILLGTFEYAHAYRLALWLCFYCKYMRKKKPIIWVKVPITVKTVGTVERAIHAASVAAKGAEFKAHGTFIHHLSKMEADEVLKQALCSWAPAAMMAFMEGWNGVRRTLTAGQPKVCTEDPETTTTHEGNPDLDGGDMPGTALNGDEYGPDDRVKKQDAEHEEKILGIRIGPDLIPTEVMQSTEGNLEAGISKRVRPLGYRASKQMTRKIERCVTALIKEVFTVDAIKTWREENPSFDDFKSRKWSSDRWRRAVEGALSETDSKIEQEFQIKTNEALPAKGKAPRPIIQCGDKAQIMMQLPVKCFEELLFHHFEDASIKHCPKYEAMERVANHLRQAVNVTTVEGDGSAWDSCCNPVIRNMTENRIIEHIIEVLGDDPEVPDTWMHIMLNDMKKKKIVGKAKVDGKKLVPPIKVIIDSIRQSGHRGTSCFNWLINFVGWMCVLCDNPEDMIAKVKKGKDMALPTLYTSAVDGKTYKLKYAFEGDDSALTTTEKLENEYIEKEWKSLGFRMKLVYVKDKMTFTGFDFLCDNRGPVGKFIPEAPRNIASSSWSCSPQLKQDPKKRHEVGMAAYYARAENFKDCGPLSNYFAQIGLAHARCCKDRGLEEAEAVNLGVHETNSIVSQLERLVSEAQVLDAQTLELVKIVIPDWSEYYELKLLACDFGNDPMDTNLARESLPKSLWDPEKYEQARR